MIGFDDLDDDDRDEILDLEREDIEGASDGETLCRWYGNARIFADDVIAQLEANQVSGARDEEWVRRATGMLIGLKKGMKAMERRATELGVCIGKISSQQDKRVTELRSQLVEARAHERGVIVDWLADQYGDAAAPVIEAINARQHHTHRVEKASREREAA